MKRMALLGVVTMALALGVGAFGCGGDDEPFLSEKERCAIAELEVERCVEEFCAENHGNPLCYCFLRMEKSGMDIDSCECTGVSFVEEVDICSGELAPAGLLRCEDLALEERYIGICLI